MIYDWVQKLIGYAIKRGLITNDDIYVVRNQIMEVLNLTDWEEKQVIFNGETIEEILSALVEYAIINGVIEDTVNSRDIFDTKIMGILTPMPREVIKEFYEKYKKSPIIATDWYYDFSKNLNYVRAGRIAKDMKWEYCCEYGIFEITINLSKPEKDPRDILAAREKKVLNYPKCQLYPASFKNTTPRRFGAPRQVLSRTFACSFKSILRAYHRAFLFGSRD